MKKLILLSAIILASCNTTYKRELFTYNQNEKQIWIDSYKYEVFYGCMKEGLGNDSLRIVLQNKDLFNKNANADLALSEEARELGKKVINQMPKPYIKIDKGDEALMDKNFLSYYCLQYYASRQLDSIANAEYAKYTK
ncbi:MAG: hypothetical protein V4581_18555 [Bacteroidota bacterium]